LGDVLARSLRRADDRRGTRGRQVTGRGGAGGRPLSGSRIKTALVGDAERPGFLVNRDFALLWSGHACSVLGDNIFETTLVVWIVTDLAADESWAGLVVPGLLAAATVPVMLVGPLAGVLVDRWRDKRRVMLRADLLSALLILALLPAAGVVPLPFLLGDRPPLGVRLAAIFAVVVLASVVAQFFRPAAAVLVRDIVPEEQRPRAVGLDQTASSVALLIGPPLAAPLLIAAGAGWALLFNAASFLVSWLAVRAIRASPGSAVEPTSAEVPNLLAEFVDGLRFFRRSRVLVALTLSLTIAVLGLGALNALDVFFVTENLGASAKSYGILSAALGAGMLAGSVLGTFLAARMPLERLVWGTLAALGAIVLVYSRMTSFLPGVATIFLIGVVVPVNQVAIGPIVMRVTPREYMGRVTATINPLVQAALILGMLFGGLLYATLLHDLDAAVLGVRFGPLDTIFAGVGALCLLGAAYGRATLRERR
jgi:predicted MFS family arabinose efflux permease